jgi:phosphoglycerate dehydrogenase-like enzyme
MSEIPHGGDGEMTPPPATPTSTLAAQRRRSPQEIPQDVTTSALETFLEKVSSRSAVVGVMGLGYVGLPLAVEMARSGYRVIGFDVSDRVVATVNSGSSHVMDVASDVLAGYVHDGKI